MASIERDFLHAQLEERRHRLEAAVAHAPQEPALAQLLNEVDSALERMHSGTYGLCETCHEPIERDRLLADPLICYCIDHLTPAQQRALQQDLELAAQIQRGLLPQQNLRQGGWEVHYHYQPAGLVSGDYCDLIPANGKAGDLFFVLGDVSGKGVAASMLMSQLHAMFRSLAGLGMPLDQMVALANRVFCESAISGQYATLVCGRASSAGAVEICNAGHCPALVIRSNGVEQIGALDVPLGMFCTGKFDSQKVQLAPGDSLFLYTDGVSETRDAAQTEYGYARLNKLVGGQAGVSAQGLTQACLKSLQDFSGGTRRSDDLTIMVLRRTS